MIQKLEKGWELNGEINSYRGALRASGKETQTKLLYEKLKKSMLRFWKFLFLTMIILLITPVKMYAGDFGHDAKN